METYLHGGGSLLWQQVFNLLSPGSGMDKLETCPHGE